jgi:hypothetical protein
VVLLGVPTVGDPTVGVPTGAAEKAFVLSVTPEVEVGEWYPAAAEDDVGDRSGVASANFGLRVEVAMGPARVVR